MRALRPFIGSMLILGGLGFSGSALAQTAYCTDRSSTRQVTCFAVATTAVDTSQQLGFIAWTETRDSLSTNNWYRVPSDIQIREGTHAIVSGGTNSLQNETYQGSLPVFSVVGSHDLHAYASAWASSPIITITVNKFSPAFAPKTSATVSRIGQSVQLRADVDLERPTGVLAFFVKPPGGSAIEVARRTLNWPNNHIIDYDPRTFTFAAPYDASGEYGFSWSYLGDALNLAKTSPELKVQVGPYNTTTSLAQSSTRTLTGKPVTLTATISGARVGVPLPSGNVEFRDGTTLLGSAVLDGQGTAVLTTTQLFATGAHSLTARYLGDFDYQPSVSAAVSHDVQFDPALLTPIIDLLLDDAPAH